MREIVWNISGPIEAGNVSSSSFCILSYHNNWFSRILSINAFSTCIYTFYYSLRIRFVLVVFVDTDYRFNVKETLILLIIHSFAPHSTMFYKMFYNMLYAYVNKIKLVTNAIRKITSFATLHTFHKLSFITFHKLFSSIFFINLNFCWFLPESSLNNILMDQKHARLFWCFNMDDQKCLGLTLSKLSNSDNSSELQQKHIDIILYPYQLRLKKLESTTS